MSKEIIEDVDYLFSKINWKDSFLDGKAVQIMNDLKNKIVGLQQKADKGDSQKEEIEELKSQLMFSHNSICPNCDEIGNIDHEQKGGRVYFTCHDCTNEWEVDDPNRNIEN